ncbi:MAG: MerR family transcriptional regulator [Desulfovibrio sp.]|uniref:MerR family transcriptional regulator n=1 Tax=Desulfovibrio sp. 7SRBS1 TaxID=3378064 RepID=UPI003B3CEB58
MDDLSRYKTYKIGEAARLLGVKPYVLRFWESEFDQIDPIRKASGQRAYTEEHLRIIRRIQYLLHEKGLTIEGAKKQLTEDNRAGTMRDIERELLNMRDILLGRIPLEALGDTSGDAPGDAAGDVPCDVLDEADDELEPAETLPDENILDEDNPVENISDEATEETYFSEDEYVESEAGDAEAQWQDATYGQENIYGMKETSHTDEDSPAQPYLSENSEASAVSPYPPDPSGPSDTPPASCTKTATDFMGPLLPGVYPLAFRKPAPVEYDFTPSAEVEPADDDMDNAEPSLVLSEPSAHAKAQEAEAPEVESGPAQPSGQDKSSEAYRYSLSLIQPPD